MGKWEMVRLGDVCDGVSSNIAQKDLENNEGLYPIYGASGFIKCVNFYKHDAEYIAVVKDGAGIGRTTLHPTKSSVIGTMQAIIPRAFVNPKYLYYAVSAMNLAKYHTGATIPHIYFKDYKKETLPLPPLEVQRQIADVLDRANALIEKRKAQIDKLDLLVKSQFIEMFGDPVANSKGWEKKALGKECDLITGNTPSRAVSDYYGNFIEWIKSDNINTPYMHLTQASEMLSEAGLSVGRSVQADAILMTCIAGSISCIGNVAIADRKVSFNQQINAVVSNSNNVYYMYYLFLLSKSYIQSTVSMSLKGILSKGKLSELDFPFPPVDLQIAFGDFVQQVEAQKTLLDQSLAKLELNYKSLMQKCFNGEVF